MYIPKSKDKLRPLGIPVLEDKLLQTATAKILGAIYEQEFLSCSYGYRPAIGALDGVKDITNNLMNGKYNYIVDADIKGFFDNVHHEWMVEMLELRINDNAFIRLIKKWLKAGIIEELKVIHPEKGTPQGASVSPILSNIYLNFVEFQLYFKRCICIMCWTYGLQKL